MVIVWVAVTGVLLVPTVILHVNVCVAEFDFKVTSLAALIVSLDV